MTPYCDTTGYRPPAGLSNPHLQTILPALFRRVRGIKYQRERIATPDDDFLDLDWSYCGRPVRRLVVVSHGLEGDANRHYVRGTVRAFHREGWDAVAWNYRGCSGEPNRRPEFYHSGASHDLHTVIMHLLRHYAYRQLALVGYSIGGNITLKYLGEQAGRIDGRISAAVAVSVPCDLTSASHTMDRASRRIYMIRFMRKLRRKIRDKQPRYPQLLDDRGLGAIRTFREFDNRYTAPLHGFRDARDYWQRASAGPWLEQIRVPTLIINAADDPFLAPPCYPYEAVEKNPMLQMQVPKYGGHVGFLQAGCDGVTWAENRARTFIQQAAAGT